LKKICNLLSFYLVYFISTDLLLKFTLYVRKKKSLRKYSKLRATGGLRKQWGLGVKSKVESSTPPPPPHLALSHWWAYWQAELSHWWAH